MVTSVRDLMGEDSTTATQVTSAQILNFLNNRMAELCADTDANVSAWYTTTVSGQSDYSVPPEYTGVEKIQFCDEVMGKQWLTKCEVEDLDPALPPGAPHQFAVWGANVSGDHQTIFILDHIPDFTATLTAEMPVGNLQCFGRQYAKTMVSGGQGPEVDLREQWTVVYGAVASCFLRFAEGSPACLALADRWEAKWERGKKEAMNRVAVDVRSPRRAVDTMGYSRGRW
jgi:hypothetical protein